MSCFFDQVGMAMIADSLPPPLIQGVLGGGVHGVAGNGLPKRSFQMRKNMEIESAVYSSIMMYNLCHYIAISCYYIIRTMYIIYKSITRIQEENSPVCVCVCLVHLFCCAPFSFIQHVETFQETASSLPLPQSSASQPVQQRRQVHAGERNP